VKRDKRIHGIDAAGAGDVGAIAMGTSIGPCPSCGAELRVTSAVNPTTGRRERALIHPVPFCAYYGETDPTQIECDVEEARS
jgi:hypothetical protein